MADIQLTAQQRGAVEDRGGSLLVSAAAGSGKTKVLVERVFAYLTEEHCHIDDFLIITFTRAAAAELRTKLAAELAKRVAQDPENSHLRQQMFRVYQADIKTVDGFCAQLLRQHVHLLPPVDGRCLTPDFRVLDEQGNEIELREDDDEDDVVYTSGSDNEDVVVGDTNEVLDAGFVIDEDGPEDIMNVFSDLDESDPETFEE